MAYEAVISSSIIANCSSESGYGIFVLNVPVVGSQFEIFNSSLSDLNATGFGSIFTTNFFNPPSYKDTHNELKDSKDTPYEFTFKLSSSNLTNIDSILHLNSMRCRDCSIKDAVFSIQENSQIINLRNKVEGSLMIENTKIDLSKCNDSQPFIAITDSNVQVLMNNIIYDGQDTNINLAQLASGTLILNNSMFSNIKLGKILS